MTAGARFWLLRSRRLHWPLSLLATIVFTSGGIGLIDWTLAAAPWYARVGGVLAFYGLGMWLGWTHLVLRPWLHWVALWHARKRAIEVFIRSNIL